MNEVGIGDEVDVECPSPIIFHPISHHPNVITKTSEQACRAAHLGFVQILFGPGRDGAVFTAIRPGDVYERQHGAGDQWLLDGRWLSRWPRSV